MIATPGWLGRSLCMRGETQAAIVALTAVSLVSSAVQARDLRLADSQPAGSPTVEAADQMNKLLRERSSGRHSIELRQTDRGSENFTVASVRNGMLDMARVNIEVLNAQVPATAVPVLPYLFRSTAHMRRALDGPVGEEILASLSTAGLIGLCFYDMGPLSFYSRAIPIRRVEDLRSMKVRVQPASSSVAVVRSLGATPVPIPASRVYAALKAAVIDADDDNWTTYVSSGNFRAAPHYALTRHSMAPGLLVISKIVWDQLPMPDRTIIRASAKESAVRMRARLDAAEREARRKAEQEGVEVIEDVDRKSFADALVPLHPVLLGNDKLLDMVKRIRADDEMAHKP